MCFADDCERSRLNSCKVRVAVLRPETPALHAYQEFLKAVRLAWTGGRTLVFGHCTQLSDSSKKQERSSPKKKKKNPPLTEGQSLSCRANRELSSRWKTDIYESSNTISCFPHATKKDMETKYTSSDKSPS